MYSNYVSGGMNPEEPVAFVLRTSAVSASEQGSVSEGYAITTFGDYCVFIPWKYLLK
ncbi:MAG: hypothetical protein J6Z22_05140 [Lachnospiraceae bacterium]|nr:hypothetical protein [Lachnospiraceae bacterium]